MLHVDICTGVAVDWLVTVGVCQCVMSSQGSAEVILISWRVLGCPWQVFENFKDWQFFMGESCNVEGMLALLNYREDGVTPYMLFFRDGLIEEKQVSVFWGCLDGSLVLLLS